MEGPSLYLAAKQLAPFKEKQILAVSGNTTIGKERLHEETVKDIFSWGKHLVFQLDTFAMRVHFMLFGTFEAEIEGESVTGDYKRARVPRLLLEFPNGTISMFNCSIKFIEDGAARKSYDFSVDIMSPKWDPEQSLRNMAKEPDEEIADVLLDQEVFAGVGNIIKNEVLSIVRINPKTTIRNIPLRKRKEIVVETRSFSKQFLAWRKKFLLRKNLKVHGRGTCPHCSGKLIKQKTGKRDRWSYYCPVCQPEGS
jgi:endonuclease VIII